MSTTYALSKKGFNSTTATCTTGSESAPTLVTDGLSLEGVESLSIHVESTAAAFSAGTLQAYLWNPNGYTDGSGQWNRCSALDFTVTAGLSGQAFAGLKVDGPMGRIDFRPNNLGQACKVFINTTSPRKG
jgi:hypothetical protein